jgi:uncharacterized membrane protein
VVILGLILSALVLAFAFMPLYTLIRVARMSREIEALRSRITALESTTAVAPVAAVAPGAPVAPVAPAVPIAPIAPVAPAVPSAPVAPVAPASPAAPIAPTAPSAPDAPDLESRIGGRWLLYAGVLALLFGVSFFLRYAFENEWVTEAGRVAIGLVTGAALTGGGLRLAAGGLRLFGHALAGTGLAVLYLAVYAALDVYALIDRTTAFAGMALVTVAAAALADRERSQPLAFIAVGGGFLTPFLVGGDGSQLLLFTYVTFLVTATLLLALRHQWPALNAVSDVMTVLTVSVWSATHYTEDQWLRTLLFLTLFCALFLIILREMSSRSVVPARAHGGATLQAAAWLAAVRHDVVTGLVLLLLATAPLLYHVASVMIAAAHPPAIHVYLIGFTLAGLWLTADPHRPRARVLVLLGALVPLFGTLTLPEGRSWILPNAVTILAIAALHLMALVDRTARQRRPLVPADLLTLHLTGLGLFALLYATLQPVYPHVRGSLAAAIAAGAVGLWQWLRPRDGLAAANAAALAFTLAAIGIGVEFDGPIAVMGWAAEGAAVFWIGLRARSRAFRIGGMVLWALAALRLIDSFFDTPSPFTPVLNTRALATLLVVALAYTMAWHVAQASSTVLRRLRLALHIAASVLTLMWITAEISGYWTTHYLVPQAYLYEQVMLSLAWGFYGSTLIVAGMWRAYPPARYIGITIIAVTILKVFFYDLWELGGIYRVIGFLAFGILLVLVSYLYQKRKTNEAVSAS